MVLSHTCLLALSPALAPGSTQAPPKAFTPELFHWDPCLTLTIISGVGLPLTSYPIPACPIFRPVSPRPLLSITARSRNNFGPCLLKGSAEREKGEDPAQTRCQAHRSPGRGFTVISNIPPSPPPRQKGSGQRGQGRDKV